jgi:hypothetical protein
MSIREDTVIIVSGDEEEADAAGMGLRDAGKFEVVRGSVKKVLLTISMLEGEGSLLIIFVECTIGILEKFCVFGIEAVNELDEEKHIITSILIFRG